MGLCPCYDGIMAMCCSPLKISGFLHFCKLFSLLEGDPSWAGTEESWEKKNQIREHLLINLCSQKNKRKFFQCSLDSGPRMVTANRHFFPHLPSRHICWVLWTYSLTPPSALEQQLWLFPRFTLWCTRLMDVPSLSLSWYPGQQEFVSIL